MKTPISRSLVRLAAAAFVASTLNGGAIATAAAETKLKMVMNWKYEGPQGIFYLADDRGYFKAEGLEISFDQGNGSGAGVPLVANGSYDVAFGDINALIDLASKKPDEAPIAVAVLYNQPPFTIAVKADGPIRTAADLEGKTLGSPANDGAFKLFPAFCKLAKIDCSTIKLTNMQPNLREQMLMQGQVDGVFGYVNTIRFAAKLMRIDTDKELRFIRYGDYGMNLYSNSIIVSKKLVKDHPEAVAGLLRAINKGLNDTIKDPDAAIAAAVKREPLLKAPLEREKLIATMRDEMSSPEIATIGIGAADPQRLKTSIDILVDASKLPSTPKIDDIFNGAFLPPADQRAKKLF